MVKLRHAHICDRRSPPLSLAVSGRHQLLPPVAVGESESNNLHWVSLATESKHLDFLYSPAARERHVVALYPNNTLVFFTIPHRDGESSSSPPTLPRLSSPVTPMAAAPVDAIAEKTRESLWDRVTLSQLKHLAAGGVAGAVSRTAVSPLERMKILYQLQVSYITQHILYNLASQIESGDKLSKC